jgi:hypothetical protein
MFEWLDACNQNVVHQAGHGYLYFDWCVDLYQV